MVVVEGIVNIHSGTWFLIVDKIQDGGQDGDHVWQRYRPSAASPPIKYTSTCWQDQRLSNRNTATYQKRRGGVTYRTGLHSVLLPLFIMRCPRGTWKLLCRLNFCIFPNSWFALDVTKNQTDKLSILLSFYFHQVLQYLNTFIYTRFWFKGLFVLRERTLEVLGFCLTRHLADGQESSCMG